MIDTPKIIKATALRDRKIEVQFENGQQYIFDFESFFEYKGYYAFLSDLNQFLNLHVEPYGKYVFWINNENEEVELDPAILYSICSREKIIIDGKTVFDPALGKNAWS